jgi:hypothetical protein
MTSSSNILKNKKFIFRTSTIYRVPILDHKKLTTMLNGQLVKSKVLLFIIIKVSKILNNPHKKIKLEQPTVTKETSMVEF